LPKPKVDLPKPPTGKPGGGDKPKPPTGTGGGNGGGDLPKPPLPSLASIGGMFKGLLGAALVLVLIGIVSSLVGGGGAALVSGTSEAVPLTSPWFLGGIALIALGGGFFFFGRKGSA